MGFFLHWILNSGLHTCLASAVQISPHQ
jgi:hypothetical protein